MSKTKPAPKPVLQVHFYLVGHGYQMDIVNHARATADGNAVEMLSICRDFAGTYDVADIADAIELALPKMMQRLERDYLHSRVLIVSEKECGDQSSAISQARTLLATRPRDLVKLRLKKLTKPDKKKTIRDLLLSVATEDRFTIVYES